MITNTSRYALSELVYNETNGTIETSLRKHVYYMGETDDIVHSAKEGDTWHSLAAMYYIGIINPEQYWWIIADYQPNTTIDPTINIQPGDIIIIPSMQFVQSTLQAVDDASDNLL